MTQIYELLQRLDEVPNVPFFSAPISRVVLDLVEQLGLTGKGVQVKRDALGLYITLTRGRNTHRTFLYSHLDHPGFVFSDQNTASPLGSVGGEGNLGISAIKSPREIDLYDKNGKLIVTTPVSIKYGVLTTNLVTATNSVGMWHIEETDYSSDVIKMRSADNHVSTVVALLVAANIWRTQKDVNLTLVFTSVEEIYQMSATGICLRNTLGTPNRITDVCFVVETMETKPFRNSLINYNSGPLIKINDDLVVYRSDNYNESEQRLLMGAQGMQHQYGLSGGYTDATALSLFTQCPNIATLAIPCRNKHNVNESGAVSTENVYLHDICSAIEILEKAVIANNFSDESLATFPVFESIGRSEKSVERIKKYKQNRARLSREFYFCETPLDWLMLACSRIF